jgi:virginiamycin B lyase
MQLSTRPAATFCALLLAGLLAPASAGAALDEFPTCSLPLTVDQALCTDGRSPSSITAGPDGAMWFTTFGGNDVGRVAPDGSLVLTPTPDTTGPTDGRGLSGIVTGPDGALWFTEFFGNRIGRMTTAGAFSFVDDPGAKPDGIAVGSDGALWITEPGSNSIGRVTTGGALSHFPLPASSAPSFIKRLGGITAGPDGRLWFAEIANKRIGAITTSGAVTEYPLPGGAGSPEQIARGPDGNLWFTQFDSDQVGRIKPSGSVTEFPLPGLGPASVTTGPDHKVWVGGGRIGLLARLNGSGPPDTVPILSGAVVNAIAAGPDKALWFGETATNRIGRLGGIAGAAAAVAVPKPTLARPVALKLRGRSLRVTVRATGPAKVKVLVALSGRRELVLAAKLRRPHLAGSTTSSVRAGKYTIRVLLKHPISGARRLHLHVAVKATGVDKRVSVSQRALAARG